MIRRVIAEIGKPIFGFETVKEISLSVPGKGDPVYIYEAGSPRVRTADNLAGYCGNRCFTSNRDVFNRYAPKLLQPVPEEHIILLDEIGRMESSAEAFRNAILSLLDTLHSGKATHHGKIFLPAKHCTASVLQVAPQSSAQFAEWFLDPAEITPEHLLPAWYLHSLASL